MNVDEVVLKAILDLLDRMTQQQLLSIQDKARKLIRKQNYDEACRATGSSS